MTIKHPQWIKVEYNFMWFLIHNLTDRPTIPPRSQSLALITSEVDADDGDGEDTKKSPFISLRTEKSTSLNISVEVSGGWEFRLDAEFYYVSCC